MQVLGNAGYDVKWTIVVIATVGHVYHHGVRIANRRKALRVRQIYETRVVRHCGEVLYVHPKFVANNFVVYPSVSFF